jgi:hypothetical protein
MGSNEYGEYRVLATDIGDVFMPYSAKPSLTCLCQMGHN